MTLYETLYECLAIVTDDSSSDIEDFVITQRLRADNSTDAKDKFRTYLKDKKLHSEILSPYRVSYKDEDNKTISNYIVVAKSQDEAYNLAPKPTCDYLCGIAIKLTCYPENARKSYDNWIQKKIDSSSGSKKKHYQYRIDKLRRLRIDEDFGNHLIEKSADSFYSSLKISVKELKEDDSFLIECVRREDYY